jgi:acyl-coenzyme A thioesterase PaaI-like protein
LQELGFRTRRVGDELHGEAAVTPEMFVPGTDVIRASIVAAWTDMLCGFLVVDLIAPRVPVTLALDVQFYEPPSGLAGIRVAAHRLKAGRAVAVLTVELTSDDGTPIGMGSATFMPAPDPSLTIGWTTDDLLQDRVVAPLLAVPFAERVGCTRERPGVALLHRNDETINSSRTVNGGLIALAVEEAALSCTPGATLSGLDLQFLQPVRVGPAVASAHVRAGLGRVEVRDAGADDRLAVLATTRTFGAGDRVGRPT